jgi:hypothetical protein
MKFMGNTGEQFADYEKEEPCRKNPRRALSQAFKTHKTPSLCQRRAREFFQALGANHPVIVLRDAFPAKKSPALGTLRHGFANSVVETALMCQRLHFKASNSWR